jgi:hypothetical protein
MVECRDDLVPPSAARWGMRRGSREVDVSSPDEEQPVLDAIENQLRIENPELVGYFSALGGMTPWIKAMNGRDQGAARRKVASRRKATLRGKRRRTDRQGFAIAIQFVLIIVVSMLLAVFTVAAVWCILTKLY